MFILARYQRPATPEREQGGLDDDPEHPEAMPAIARDRFAQQQRTDDALLDGDGTGEACSTHGRQS
jgi:hypothetical protein